MKTIEELLERNLSRRIQEVIQVHQADEQPVYDEITEYVATDSIRDQYAQLFKAIAEAPSEPPDQAGVWVSGFFGSGKSSFAKYLGLALQNRTFRGQHFAELFKEQIDDERVSNLLDLINARTPADVVLFEVAKERDTRRVTERIAELMYAVLLRELDYSDDFDVAELEIELESEGQLDEFIQTCKKLHGQEWSIVRIGAQKLSRASAVLHALDKKTYPSPDSWAHAQRNREAAITVRKVVERTFELWGRRRPGKALAFIIDEVGQHVARSSDKIEDLRATVEEFGKVGQELVKKHKIPAPCWIVITSQEKLEEVVSALGDERRIDLAKLQDRFRNRVDLAPSDIREVATRRVLAKKPDAEPRLKKLFGENSGSLNAALKLERTSRRTDVSESSFVQFYPYPPHYIELCIGIMSGIRLQPGAPRHYGGSNRTIIKQAYEMLVNERTEFAKKPIGALVTLDKVFELVEGNLSSEKQRDIYEVSERITDPADGGWSVRVAKVICLLEFVRDLPRTDANIAAFLVDEVGKSPPRTEVQAALGRLHGAQFIRNTEDGWKLQTEKEKNWETERRGYLDPKPKEQIETRRHVLAGIFDEAEFKTFRYENRTFRVGVTVDGARLGDDGDIPLILCTADDADDFSKRVAEIRDESGQKSHHNEIYWLFALTPEIDELVKQMHASRKMVEKYDQLRAQGKISPDEATCLQDEKNAVLGYETRLRDKLTAAMALGTGMFRSIKNDAGSTGKSLADIFKRLFASVVPSLYPKLEMGARHLKGDEAEQLLKAADLKALPSVIYAGDNGLALVVRDGNKTVVTATAPIAKEVLDYLKGEFNYGNKDSRMGKALEQHFCGIGYGWELEMLQLVLAALFRAGEIEVTHQGNRYASYQDPASRIPFTKVPAFRSSLFSPRQSVGLKMLTQAVQQLEDMTGEEVDVEEGAIAAAFKKVVTEELEDLYPLKALVEAHHLPVVTLLSEYLHTLTGIRSAQSDDCVRILTETGAAFGATRDRVRRLRETLNESSLNALRQARVVIEQIWPRLTAHQSGAGLAERVARLQQLLSSERFAERMADIAKESEAIRKVYFDVYVDLFTRRGEAYLKAIEDLRNRPEWGALLQSSPDLAGPLLAPLIVRSGMGEDMSAIGNGTSLGSATLTEMESDLAAVDALRASALAKLQELAMGGEKKAPVRRIRVSEIFNRPIETKEDLDAAIEQLRGSLQKALDEGVAIVLE